MIVGFAWAGIFPVGCESIPVCFESDLASVFVAETPFGACCLENNNTDCQKTDKTRNVKILIKLKTGGGLLRGTVVPGNPDHIFINTVRLVAFDRHFY